MSIGLEPNKTLRIWIKPGNVRVEAEDVEIKMKSEGVMTQGIINVALPHLKNMFRKPEELSKKIEESVGANLKEIIKLLPTSYPLDETILGTNFFVGNLFQNDIVVDKDWCYWEMSSVIIPTIYLIRYLDRVKQEKGKKKQEHPVVQLHPFDPANFDIEKPSVLNMTNNKETKGLDKHIYYCLSEFTLNTLGVSIYDLHLANFSITDWDLIPNYFQRYINMFCKKTPDHILIESQLTSRPMIKINTNGMELEIEGSLVVSAGVMSKSETKIVQKLSGTEVIQRELYHKTSHVLRLHITPRADPDFVVRFTFEKKDIKSQFQSVNFHKPVKSEEPAKNTMLEIVENMIIVEILPRLYTIGEVGIPVAINDGCLFTETKIALKDHALLICGDIRMKEFGKKETIE